MARKSNKTAHVLNLLATGHESAKETTDEAEVVENKETPETLEAPASTPASVSEPAEASAPHPTQSVSVIDKTESDPVAELIQQKLMEELEADNDDSSETENESETEMEAESEITSEETTPEEEIISEPEAAPTSETVSEEEVLPEPDPEPDFVVVNVMERIVRDKVIYFMREFDVCTCERCIADTVTLTLNGLTPKYIVTSPMAVDPLISFYTNRFISNITVEITKACMTVKENPRH